MKPEKMLRKIVSCCLVTLALFILVACNQLIKTSNYESSQVSKKDYESEITTEGKYKVLASFNKQLVKYTDKTSNNAFSFDINNGNITWSYRNENSYWKYVDKNNVECIIYDYRGDIKSWYGWVYNDEGNVVKITEKSSDGKIINWVELKYDAYGNKTEEKEYNTNGIITYRITFSYNENGDQADFIKYNANGAVFAHHEQQYDERGNKTKYKRQENGEEGWIENEYKYDDNGIKTEFVQFYADGVVKAIDKFDAAGHIVESITNREDGSENNKIETEYDSKGNKTKYKSYKNETIFLHHEWKYDDNGLLIDFIAFNAEGNQLNREKYKHDTNGNLIETIYYYGNTIKCCVKCVYDVKGNMLEMTTITPDGKVIERRVKTYSKDNIITSDMFYVGDILSMGYEEKYDSNGNRIEFIDYVNGGKIVNHFECKYDSKGNEIEAVYHNLIDSITIRCEKKYNIDGNLTEFIEFDNYNKILNRREYTYDSKKNLIECVYYDASDTVTKRDEYKYKYLDLTDEQYTEYQNIMNRDEVYEVFKKIPDIKFTPNKWD